MIITNPETIGQWKNTTSPSVRLLVDASDTHQALSVEHVHIPKGGDGAAPHLHKKSEEFFYVIQGELRILCDGEISILTPGQSALIPRNTVHAFAAAPEHTAEVLITIAPGVERFEYFRILERIFTGVAKTDELTSRQEEFDTYFVTSEVWEQR